MIKDYTRMYLSGKIQDELLERELKIERMKEETDKMLKRIAKQKENLKRWL